MMARARRYAKCVVVTLVISSHACGGGASSGPLTVNALASSLQCSDLEMASDQSERQFDAAGDASCQFAGERIQLLTYDSDSAQSRALRIFRDFGQISVVGERWTVRVGSTATATKVKARLGGTINSP